MAYVTSTIIVTDEWAAITNRVAMLQFNDEMYMAITNGAVPSETTGFIMEPREKYVNNVDGVTVWAKSKFGGTGIESIRISEDTL